MTTAPSSPGTAGSALLEERSTLKIKINKYIKHCSMRLKTPKTRGKKQFLNRRENLPCLVRGSKVEYSYCLGKNLPYLLRGSDWEYSHCWLRGVGVNLWMEDDK